MSAFLTLDTVSARTPEGQPLFSGLSLAVGADRIGVVGRNGSGKSTLMRIIAGSVEPASGSVLRSGTIGCLAQEWLEEFTLAQALGVADGSAVLRRVLSGEACAADFDAVDWSLQSRIDAALAEVGASGMTLDRRLGTLSGAEPTQVGIARFVVEAPDFLLLDEPTNNLDAAGRLAIHALLRTWRGGVLVVSHDRALLETMDRVVELTPIGVRVVRGGWSAFERMRDGERAKAAFELERSEAELREVRIEVQRQREAKERRDKAGRAFAAKRTQSKILLDARAERAENTGGRIRQLTLPLGSLSTGVHLLEMEQVTVSAGARTLGP